MANFAWRRFWAFGISHGAIGLFIGAYYLYEQRKSKPIELRRSQFPDSPIAWREDWARGVSKSDFFDNSLIWLYTLAVVAISVWWTTVNFWIWNSPYRFYVSAACLPGVVPLYFFIKTMRSRKANRQLELKFGDSLEMGKMQRLSLKSESGLPRGMDRKKFKWVLKNTDSASTSENATTKTHSTTEVEAEDQSLSVLTLRVNIPTGKPTTAVEPSDKGVRWELVGKGPLVKLGPFQLPIFEYASEIVERESQSEIENAPINLEEISFADLKERLNRENVTYTTDGNQSIFTFAAGRKVGQCLTGLFVGLVMASAGSVWLFEVAKVLLVVLSFVSALGVFIFIGSLFSLFTRISITATDESIEVEKKFFGFKLTNQFLYSNTRQFVVKPRWGENADQPFAVFVELNEGHTVCITPAFTESYNCQLFAKLISEDKKVITE